MERKEEILEKSINYASKPASPLDFRNRIDESVSDFFVVKILKSEDDTTQAVEEKLHEVSRRGYKNAGRAVVNVPWFYVSFNSKLYFSGKIGVDMLYGRKMIGNHAISYSEFLILDDIFSKYEGYSILNFDVK